MVKKNLVYDGVEIKKGNMFNGVLISRVSPDGKTITGVHETAGIRTLHLYKDGWRIVGKHTFTPCPNRSWHHLGTTCEVCGQKG